MTIVINLAIEDKKAHADTQSKLLVTL